MRAWQAEPIEPVVGELQSNQRNWKQAYLEFNIFLTNCIKEGILQNNSYHPQFWQFGNIWSLRTKRFELVVWSAQWRIARSTAEEELETRLTWIWHFLTDVVYFVHKKFLRAEYSYHSMLPQPGKFYVICVRELFKTVNHPMQREPSNVNRPSCDGGASERSLSLTEHRGVVAHPTVQTGLLTAKDWNLIFFTQFDWNSYNQWLLVISKLHSPKNILPVVEAALLRLQGLKVLEKAR